jgi:hypothetical protein
MIGSVFDLFINVRTTLEEEKDVWYNTTQVKVFYDAPPCPISQDQVDQSNLKFESITMETEKGFRR